MPESNKLTGIKKRQQIHQAGRTVFIWVAIASVVVSIALVLAQFMVRQAIFNNKVLGEKYTTDNNLKHNLENADELKKQVEQLVGDTNLSSVKANEKDSNLKVVLDALPTKNEPLALGSSLQLVVFPKSGVGIEALTTQDASDSLAESGDLSAGTDETADGSGSTSESSAPTEIPFSFTIVGNIEQIKNALNDLERTIRPINVKSLTVEGNDTQLKATGQATAYYQPSKTLKLQNKTVKP